MEVRNAAHLRLVESDEDRSGQSERQHENTSDQFAPVGIGKVLAEAFHAMRECMRHLENTHRRIRLDEEYVTRKSELMAVGELIVEMAAEPAAGMAGASAAEAGRIYSEFDNAFCWLHAAVSGYFDQVAEIYTGPGSSARNAQGSVNNYLPNTFESLLKNTFVVAKAKYLREAISAAAALVILGILPAGIRQIQKEDRDHVRRKVLAIIQDLGEEHAFRYVPERQIFQLLGMSRDKFEERVSGQKTSANQPESRLASRPMGSATIGRSADQSIPSAIFALRSQVGIPDFDAAARITNLTALEVVK